MEIQTSNFAKSWQLRDSIVSKIKNELIKLKFKENFVLFANVPHHLKKNYNNESVFFTKWNLESHLKMYGMKNLKQKVHLVSYRHLNDRNYNPSHNIMFDLNNLEHNNEYYYFEIQENNNVYQFINFKNKNELITFFDNLKVKNINNHPIILREKIRLKLKKIIKDNFKI